MIYKLILTAETSAFRIIYIDKKGIPTIEFLCLKTCFLLRKTDWTRDSGVTKDDAGLSIPVNSHIPRYSTNGADYTVGDKTCRHQAGVLPSSPLQDRKSCFDK